MAALRPWRGTIGAHWTERARQLYPARVAAAAYVWVIPANFALAGLLLFPQSQYEWSLSAVTAWVGALLATYFFDREIFPDLRLRHWLHQALVAWFMRFAGWLVLVIAACAMPPEFGWEGWAIAGAALGLQIWLAWDLWIRLLRSVRILKPAPERLRRIVAETAERMGLSACEVWILDSMNSYAAAFPTKRALVFSERLLEAHPDHEIAAISAHELAHLNESRSILMARVAGSLTFSPWMLFTPVSHALESFRLALIILGTSSFLMMAFTRRLSRRLETRADRTARDFQCADEVYANALERIYRANQMPAVMPNLRFATHPHLYDRLIAAGVTPEYARPAVPGSNTTACQLCSGCLGILIAVNFRHLL